MASLSKWNGLISVEHGDADGSMGEITRKGVRRSRTGSNFEGRAWPHQQLSIAAMIQLNAPESSLLQTSMHLALTHVNACSGRPVS